MADEGSDFGWLWKNLTPPRKRLFIVSIVGGLIVSIALGFVHPGLVTIFFLFLLLAWVGALTSVARRLANSRDPANPPGQPPDKK